MEKITRELDRIASAIEHSDKLSTEERLVVARMIDEVSDHLEKIAYMDKHGMWLDGDEDEKAYMKRYDQAGVVDGMADADEKYMKDYEEGVGKGKWENPDEKQRVLEEYHSKYKPGYETRDLNTDVHDEVKPSSTKPKQASERDRNLEVLASLKKRK